MAEMVRLAIDFENPSPKWWEGGGRDLWDAILEGFDNNDVVVDRSIADSWLAEAAKLPVPWSQALGNSRAVRVEPVVPGDSRAEPRGSARARLKASAMRRRQTNYLSPLSMRLRGSRS